MRRKKTTQDQTKMRRKRTTKWEERKQHKLRGEQQKETMKLKDIHTPNLKEDLEGCGVQNRGPNLWFLKIIMIVEHNIHNDLKCKTTVLFVVETPQREDFRGDDGDEAQVAIQCRGEAAV
jgi:hypothetical protein